MLRALIFDFNGVIVDDEQIHFELFKKVLKDESITLDREDYYSKYLGYDDVDCFRAVYRDQGQSLSDEQLKKLILTKEKLYLSDGLSQIPLVPGVKGFIESVAVDKYVAIVSGALRSEIEALLEQFSLIQYISTIVAAGEAEQGKPAPDMYLKVLRDLNRDHVQADELLFANECVVFEDSPWGMQAAVSADMHCVGVKTGFSDADLNKTLFNVNDFTQLTLADIESRL